MKLPAVAMAAAFAGGLLLGGLPFLHCLARPSLLIAFVGVTLLLLILGFVLTGRGAVWPASGVSVATWLALGVLAAVVAGRPLPPEHVLSRFAANQIPQGTPLRWHGILRAEPARLPWGSGLEISLTGVETAAGYVPTTGGMRLAFTPREGDVPLPVLHAGDEVAALTEARLPLAYRDAGAFDRREFLARQDIHVLASLRASTLLEKKGAARPTMAFRMARMRGLLRERIDGMFPESPQTAAVLRAMLLGDRSFIERSESVDYQKTGVFHVLVVAGLHVGALAFFLFWVARKLHFPQTAKTLFVLTALLAYVAVVELRAPVLRAALMAAIVIVGSHFYRRLDLLNSAALAALVLLIANPKFINDTGFLLSFLAIGAIAGIALPLIERSIQPFLRALDSWRDVTRDAGHPPAMAQFRLDFRDVMTVMTGSLAECYAKRVQDLAAKGARLGLRATELFVLSLILQLCMLPLMAQDFHRISLFGPVVNVCVVPLMGVIVPFGFVTLGVATVLPRLALLAAHPLVWLVLLQQYVVSFFAAIPLASYRIPGPPVWVLFTFFVAVLGMVLELRSARTEPPWKWRALQLMLCVSATIIAVHPFRPATVANSLEITVLDVAQGDSILVVSPKGSTLLIDGGGAFEGFRGREEHLGSDPGEEAVSAYLWSRGFKKLDAVALTHAHQDHIGGLTAVLQNFRVSRLLLGRETAAPAFAKLKRLAADLHIPVEHERRTASFLWDGVQMDVLWPEIAQEEVAPLAKNNDSLVVRLQYHDRTILLPGDAEKQVEYEMLAENDPAFLHADVLKVAHHGSKNSTMPELLNVVAPQISIISAGEVNPYGHPSPELLQRLEESGTRIYRTDQDGAVRVLTDGENLQVSCFIDCANRTIVSAKTQPPNEQQTGQH